MSLALRQFITEKVTFSSSEDEGDLLDPIKTSTYLVALLADLRQRASHPLLLTSVYSSHFVDSPRLGHGHHPEAGPGWAVDFWNQDFADVGDDKILELLKLLPDNPYCWTVGLGGSAQKYRDQVRWPDDGKFILFVDNHTDHVHVQAGNINGAGWRT